MPDASPGLLAEVELVTPPSLALLSLAECRLQCRLGSSTAEDDLLTIQIAAATAFIERETGLQLLTATFDVRASSFWGGGLRLPRRPLQSVTSVKYYDLNGVEQTLASTYYQVNTFWRAPGSVELKPDQTWPSVQPYKPWPVTIRFTAGWTSVALVPVDLRQAALLLVGHWFEHRMAITPGLLPGASIAVPLGVADLLTPWSWGGYW